MRFDASARPRVQRGYVDWHVWAEPSGRRKRYESIRRAEDTRVAWSVRSWSVLPGLGGIRLTDSSRLVRAT